MILSLPLILFFQKVHDESLEKAMSTSRTEEEQKILCKVCQSLITSPIHRIEVHGQHHHVFTNPSGLTFEIGCFSFVPGGIHGGTPTLEYTWFKGYLWQITLCRHCFAHLGWFYQSHREDHFTGLILKNLIGSRLI